MNNVYIIPTAKTLLYHNPVRPGPEAIDYVYDHGLMELTGKQKKLTKKRIKIADKIIEALPVDKRYLFNEYVELQLKDACMSIDKAIEYTIEHEAQIEEVMAGWRY